MNTEIILPAPNKLSGIHFSLDQKEVRKSCRFVEASEVLGKIDKHR